MSPRFNPYLRGYDHALFPFQQQWLAVYGSECRVLRFTTGGFADTASERMRIDVTGNVGIGTQQSSGKSSGG